MRLDSALDWLCWISALFAIATYVAALLRNRPHLRPAHSLGLLLLGGALLGLPTVMGRPISPDRAPYAAYLVLLLAASALIQGFSALRRRRTRDGGLNGAFRDGRS